MLQEKNYSQYFSEINIEGFDFSNGFECSDDHKIEKLINLSINIFELNFYPVKNQWKHNLIPIEIIKNESDKIIDLILYENQYVFIKKLNVFRRSSQKFYSQTSLNSYTSENIFYEIYSRFEKRLSN